MQPDSTIFSIFKYFFEVVVVVVVVWWRGEAAGVPAPKAPDRSFEPKQLVCIHKTMYAYIKRYFPDAIRPEPECGRKESAPQKQARLLYLLNLFGVLFIEL